MRNYTFIMCCVFCAGDGEIKTALQGHVSLFGAVGVTTTRLSRIRPIPLSSFMSSLKACCHPIDRISPRIP